MKVNLYFSETIKLEIDMKNAHLFDEDSLYEVPLDVVSEFENLKKQMKKMQETLDTIYRAKNP